jgi:hypothetical protein
MKYAENGGDVRGTSANVAYMGVVFSGSIDEAIAQAKAAPEHGIPQLNGRAELMSFLRVDKIVTRPRPIPYESVDVLDEVEYGAPEAPSRPWDKFSPYSLEYAMARWPESFKR